MVAQIVQPRFGACSQMRLLGNCSAGTAATAGAASAAISKTGKIGRFIAKGRYGDLPGRASPGTRGAARFSSHGMRFPERQTLR